MKGLRLQTRTRAAPLRSFAGRLGALGALLFLLASPGAPADDEPQSLAEAIREGAPTLGLRYRYEEVSDDAVGEREAHASTLRTALGYRTAPFKGWSFFVEAEDVTVVGNELYRNAGAGGLDNGIADRPVVADPEDTEINQAYVELAVSETTFKLGIAEIALGDQRFVGPVGWRQNHQSFDAFSVANASLEKVRFFYAFVDDTNRINGGNDPMASHLLNVDVELGGSGKLYLYGYLLDYDHPGRWGLSTSTLGARFTGERVLAGERSFAYEAAYALQEDSADNPRRIDADYFDLILAYGVPKLRVRVGFERLDGSAADGQFQTPLATLHKFNGWADRFLSTPTNGLDDLSLQLEGRPQPFSWVVRYHDFSASTGGASYGTEIDLLLTYRAPWGQTFGLKGALYDADEFAADTDKVMVFTEFAR